MGVVIPQVVTFDRASGAQVIDGSLRIDSTKNHYLKRTFASGNRKTFTISAWVKRSTTGGVHPIFARYTANSEAGFLGLYINSDDNIYFTGWSTIYLKSDRLYRDTNGWSNIVVKVDTTQSTASDRIKLYFNGELQTLETYNAPSEDADLVINENVEHRIGNYNTNYFNGQLSQVYFIDGQALGPENFGFTDGLTNTWKPRKYTGTFGTNGFWLPMDGNSLIGKDQSGNGNDWSPFNFGGSIALDKATGARPILNTLPGGTQAGVGVFGSKQNVGYAVTVAPKTGGGNAYYIDGVERQTLTGLIRGVTYTFDQSDSSNDNHPLRLSITDDGTHTGGGAQYTNGNVQGGTPGTAGAATTITIPYNAPNTLYYYCGNHSGMGNNITGITTNEKLADQYASHCVLALPLLNNKEDVSTSIACTSSTRAVSASGNAAAAYESSNFYGGSFEFDGTGDYLDVTESDNCFDFGTGDFTIELWALLDNNNDLIGTGSNWVFLGSGKSGWVIRRFDEGIKFDYQSNGSWVFENTFGTEASKDKWNHIAITRSGSTMRCFSNGVQQGSDYSNSTDIISTEGYCRVGGGYGEDSNLLVDGYIQDVRIYKGVAKYTSDFVVPSPSPDILPDTPSGVSGGSKLTKITDGAVGGFETTSDYLSLAASSDFEFTGDHTIEMFIYHNTLANDSVPYATGGSGSADQIYISSDGEIYYASGQTGALVSPAGSVSIKKWQHLAISKSGTNLRAFVDGKIVVSSSNHSSTIGSDSATAYIGVRGADGYHPVQGFISNFRIVKGSAVYTSEFTPPTAPLTNVTNTKLLCCQSNRTSGAAAVSPNISGSLNNGRVWSSLVTGPTRVEDRIANAFNGSTSSPGAIAAYPGTLTFAPGLSSISTVRIYGYHAGSGVTLHVNGSAQSPSSGASFDITINTSTLDSIVWTAVNGSNYMRLDAVVVDGTTLIDPVVGPDDSNEAATTFNPFNTDINTVRGQEAGYATLNPLHAGPQIGLQDGNLKFAWASSGNYHQLATSTLAMPGDGKWYCEMKKLSSRTNSESIGILREDGKAVIDGAGMRDDQSGTPSYSYEVNGQKNKNASGSSYGASWSQGDMFGIAVDLTPGGTSGTIEFYKNGVSQGVAYSDIDTSYSWLFACDGYGDSGQTEYEVNFGQKPFMFAPPDGFQPLNLDNTRPIKVIARPDQFVNVTTYTGSNGTNHKITSGIDADLIWIKNISADFDHALYDTIRLYSGPDEVDGSSRALIPNKTDAQGNLGEIVVLNDGFNLLNAASSYNASNNYVAWSWKAGGKKNTFNVDDVGYASASAAGLDGGTLNPTAASVGTKQGFSIIQWTGDAQAGRTISHGLSQTPSFIVHKSASDDTYAWNSWHKSLSTDYYVAINATSAQDNSVNIWPTAGITDSVITTTSATVKYNNLSGETHIAYIWHDVPGLQKFGSFEGNGSANGPFVELGFKPAVVILKNIDNYGTGYDWFMFDNQRDENNPCSNVLLSNSADNASSSNSIDFLSNGFKIRASTNGINLAAHTIIYMAWAEAPAVNLFGGGANAR